MEIKFYEKIGVRYWKNFILWFEWIFDVKAFNYHVKNIDLKSIKDFRSMLLFNSIPHFIALIISIIGFSECLCNMGEINIVIILYYIILY